MSNSIENPSFEPKPERKEKFEDLGIEIGDRIYAKNSDAYREVRNIIDDDNHFGGGYITVDLVDNEDTTIQKLNFGNLLQRQDYIERIEKPPIPRDTENVSARHKAALQQIAKQLETQEHISDEDKRFLKRKRAAIFWEIAEKKSKGI